MPATRPFTEPWAETTPDTAPAPSLGIRVLLVFGTRPEAIKMAPIHHAMRTDRGFSPLVCVTAQHRQMLDPFLAAFGIHADFDLDLMTPGQDLIGLTARALEGLRAVLGAATPDLVLVQGDTTSALAGALAAFYLRIPVGHVEAGLRTHDLGSPFPEEGNRALISRIAEYHFAPTDANRCTLIRENIPRQRIWVTGNTVVDALLWMSRRVEFDAARLRAVYGPATDAVASSAPLVLITAHRRENHGAPLERICRAVTRLAERNPDTAFVFPVHLNPEVRDRVHCRLAGPANVHLTPPLEYPAFVHLLNRCTLVLTDSGGIQEEAPALNKPVLVMRESTERGEGVEKGTLLLVGTDPDRIVAETESLLTDRERIARIAGIGNPYGDGTAAKRILAALRNRQHRARNAEMGMQAPSSARTRLSIRPAP